MSVALASRDPYPVAVQQRRCSKCGKLVSRAAYACRRCGKSQRIRPRTFLLCLAAALMIGMFAVASAGSLFPQAHPGEAATLMATSGKATSERVPGQPVAPGPTLEVSAVDLWMSYLQDAASADRRYREHAVLVTGDIRALERNYDGGMVVRLSAGDAFDTVNATLAPGNYRAQGMLAKGHAVSLLCVGRGALMGAPLLGSCSVR